MFAIVSRELVAAEGHYHRSCYHSYTATREKRGTSYDVEGGKQAKL